MRGTRPGDVERGARRPQVAVASPHPLPACRASLCRSAASGHSARARAPLAPPPFSSRSPPPPPARLELVGVIFFFLNFFFVARPSAEARRSGGGLALLLGSLGKGWGRPLPAFVAARRQQGRPELARVREVGRNGQRPPGSGLTLFPLRDLAFLRQEGNRRSRFRRPHPLGCHFFFFLVRGQAQGFLHGAEPPLSAFKELSACWAHGRRERNRREPRGCSGSKSFAASIVWLCA